jgi:hypothetical protein
VRRREAAANFEEQDGTTALQCYRVYVKDGQARGQRVLDDPLEAKLLGINITQLDAICGGRRSGDFVNSYEKMPSDGVREGGNIGKELPLIAVSVTDLIAFEVQHAAFGCVSDQAR